MRSLRIALVCPYDLRRAGGVRTHIAGLGGEFRARGHDVEVIAPSDAGTLESLPVIQCGGAREIGFSGTHIDLTWAAWRRVREVCGRGYDVMHFHTIWNPAIPFQLAMRFRGAKVATFHDVAGPDTPRWARALMTPASSMIRRAWLDRVIAVSPAVGAYLAPGTFVTIPNGISIPSSLPPDGERNGVLFIGRLEPRKGVRTLLEAAALLGAACPPITIAGDGRSRGELEAHARRIAAPITFLGEVSDDAKWKLLRRTQVLVAPSLGGESFGIVLLEAMLAGAVPLAAANAGYAELLRERADELLFAPGDAAALAQKLSALLADDSRLRVLGSWGGVFARRFAWNELAPAIEAVYEGAIAAQPSRLRM
jgi:phosphatidylinositol alpha-mannosyltransferase